MSTILNSTHLKFTRSILRRVQYIFVVKGQTINVLGFVDHSVHTFCYYSLKAVMDTRYTNGYGWTPT